MKTPKALTEWQQGLSQAIPQRIRSKIEQGTDDCWWWTGRLDSEGYGYASLRGQESTAHRTIYKILLGEPPLGLQLDHLCHTRDESCPGGPGCRHRRCVNPEHLEPVTAAVNSKRARNSIPTINAAKTHCPAGHEYTPENTYRTDRSRFCRACNREAARRYRTLNKEKVEERRAAYRRRIRAAKQVTAKGSS